MPKSGNRRPFLLLALTLAMFTQTIDTLKASPAVNGVSEFKLANGLQVIVVPDRRAPVVTHYVWYRVGSADEPAGVSGIAHFLEHLMFKSTDKIAVRLFLQDHRPHGRSGQRLHHRTTSPATTSASPRTG